MNAAKNLDEYTIGELKEEKRRVGAKINSLEMSMKEIKVQITDLNQKRSDINKLIKEKTSEVSVSDHAVLRYIERVLGVDTEDFRRELLTPDLQKRLQEVSNCKFEISPGVIVVVQNRVVTTCITKPRIRCEE